MLGEYKGAAPEKEVEAVVTAVATLFTAVAQRLEPEAGRLLAAGMQSGTLKPKFTMVNGTITGAVVLPNGEEILLFQRMSPAAIHHGLQN